MEKIRVLIVEPNKEPYQAKIKKGLEEKQKIVGGLIEFVELEHNVDLICNDEGKILNLEMNRVIQNDIICGTFIIAGQHEGETISLSKKQIEKYKKVFQLKPDKPIIEFLKQEKINSTDLLGLNLIGVEKLKGFLVSDEEIEEMEGE